MKGNNTIGSHKTAAVLQEIAAENASGDIKAIYSALERALDVRLVNLVYRHLATVPGALEWAWGTVGPAFQNGTFADRSAALSGIGEAATTGRVYLEASGLSGEQGVGVIKTLDAYNRANPMNALSLRVIEMALTTGRPAVWTAPQVDDTGDLRVLLPMVPLDEVPPATMDALYRLAHLTTGKDRGLIPSLFRHFSAWPSLLAALADWLEPLATDGVIERQVASVSAQADEIARDIFKNLNDPGGDGVFPDEVTRESLLQTIEIFPPAICRMIVIGGLLRTAIRP